MNAVPATACGAAGSWKRSSQAETALGDGTVRSRGRRQRACNERRSARDSKSRSIACSTALKPLSPSSRFRSSTQSPPAKFRKMSASTTWMSSQPCAPTTCTCWRIASGRPLAWIRSRYSGSPASEVRPALESSASYWKPRTPCGNVRHPVGDGPRIANPDYLPDSSGPTEHRRFLGAGFRQYMRNILTQQGQGLAAVPAELKVLIELVMFFAMGAFIIISLPAIAATIGGGLGTSPGAAILNTFTTLASGGASQAVRMATPKK